MYHAISLNTGDDLEENSGACILANVKYHVFWGIC